MAGAKSKLATHLFRHDPSVPPDAKDRRFCHCGVAEDHPRHTLPHPPAQAAHRGRYDPDEVDR